MRKFRAAVEAGDASALIASLAEDVVFNSPAVFRPYRGRAAVGTILRCAMKIFRDFRYVDELTSAGQTALVFHARVGDREIQGIDLGAVDRDGLVTELTVLVRPLSAAHALAEAMGAELAKAGSGVG